MFGQKKKAKTRKTSKKGRKKNRATKKEVAYALGTFAWQVYKAKKRM